ncbi:MAG: methionine--tRNA ligase [Armatimonadota bacterium]
MPKDTYYITTPIYYVNASPHIGHAYTTIAADVLSRYRRLRGDRVCFATGTDEHGLKVASAAAEAGQSPREFTDEVSERYKQMWRRLHIEYDRFIRTSEEQHEQLVQQVFARLLEQDDIYKGTYEGWYCVHEETYLSEGELVEGKCPDCQRPVQWLAQDCYFFRTSKYAERLLQELEANPELIRPQSRCNEVTSFIRQGLRDSAVSRSAQEWDIPVPGDPSNTIYVWLDALTNYLTVAGYLQDDATFESTWPPDAQLMAKDIITRFHGTLWPAMLMALGVELPRQLFVHGFWSMGGGHKISKSRGNVVDPYALGQAISERSGASVEVAVDAVRYFVLREVPFGLDGQFSEMAVLQRFNADLANDLGNLLNRSLPFLERYFEGKVPTPGNGAPTLDQDVARTVEAAGAAMDRLEFSVALAEIWRLLAAANKYVDQQEPWSLHKAGKKAELATVVYSVADTIRCVATLVSPFMPAASAAIREQLGLEGAHDGTWDVLDEAVRLRPGASIRPGKPIFPRIDLAAIATEAEAPPAAEEEEPVSAETISYEHFSQMDLRVGEIKSAERVEGTDKLLKLEVDAGARVHTVVAGIAQEFAAETLVGRKVVLVANLQPTKIRGVVSEGMILAAGEEEALALVTVDADCPVGTKVL